MSVIVSDAGFGPDDWPADAPVVRLAADTDPARLPPLPEAALVVIAFDAFTDGRGFTLARLVRLAGFSGRLRARGELIADQYRMARRAGFDEVEISEAQAARQPQGHWLFQGHLYTYDYQSRLRNAV